MLQASRLRTSIEAYSPMGTPDFVRQARTTSVPLPVVSFFIEERKSVTWEPWTISTCSLFRPILPVLFRKISLARLMPKKMATRFLSAMSDRLY
eukprot:1124988-Rhodomonas_salina.1